MGLDKNSSSDDGIANLYRAALYLAQGSEETGREFLTKARRVLGDRLGRDLETLFSAKIIFKNDADRLFWAEKTLDCYLRLKNTDD